MRDFVRRRRGTPNFLRKLRTGQPVRIVVFGTSMSQDGQYLAGLDHAFDEWPGARTITICAFPASPSVRAIEHVDQVASERPDLLLIEFSVNDSLLEGMVAEAVAIALTRTRTAVSDVVPDCDFVQIYFAQYGSKAQPAVAIAAHEAFAEQYGIPSIDLEALTRDLIDDDEATRMGGDRALTTDGVHHTSYAARAIGIPFAEAMTVLVRSSDVL